MLILLLPVKSIRALKEKRKRNTLQMKCCIEEEDIYKKAGKAEGEL